MTNIDHYHKYFTDELKHNLLSFRMPRCIDREHGGYLNCFCNDGSRLVSTDKYTWSQGRFLWIFSKLAVTDACVFSADERQNFMEYAKNGRDFLKEHVLVSNVFTQLRDIEKMSGCEFTDAITEIC